MRAILYHRWGGPEVLEVADVAMPVPKDDEALVRVRAASVNAWDWDLMTGRRYITPPEGFQKGPKQLGFDVAGIVEAAGRDVSRFRPGDAVFGDMAWGGPASFADYACVKEKSLAAKPHGMSFEQAAALPQAGLLALQALLGRHPVAVGMDVLINGAGGGVGTLGIQIARSRGARVTAVDSAEKAEIMLAAGADEVLDYRREDFTRRGMRYDLILDPVANRPLAHFARALKPGGRLTVVGGVPGVIVRIGIAGPVRGWLTGKRMGLMIYRPNAGDTERLGQMFNAGVVTPLIDGVYPLERAGEAMQRVGNGLVRGKVVVSLD